MSRDTHEMEMLLFINAANSLAQGNHSSGLEAYTEAFNRRDPNLGRPSFKPISEESLSAEDWEYFREMGAFVELAVELSQIVD